MYKIAIQLETKFTIWLEKYNLTLLLLLLFLFSDRQDGKGT